MVFAPHPDDETFGCGGTIRTLINAGKKVKVLFLTSGDKADPSDHRSKLIKTPQPLPAGQAGPSYLKREEIEEALLPDGAKADHITEYSLMRETEAEKALKILGVADYMFMRFPDRGVYNQHEDILHKLLAISEEFSPDAIYAPSMVELNPDHRAAAALAGELQRSIRPSGAGNAPTLKAVFYEVTTPLRPNILVDITSVYNSKKKAAKRYGSQLKLMDYVRHFTALNAIRALTVNGPRYVEAFWLVERPLTDEEIIAWLSFTQEESGKVKGD